MTEQLTNIECPNCGEKIDVNSVLTHKLNEELSKKYNSEMAKERKRIEEQQASIDEQKQAIENQQAELNKQIEAAVKKQVDVERDAIAASVKAEFTSEHSAKMMSLEEQLTEAKSKAQELVKAQLEVEKIKREKDELKDQLQLEMAQTMNAQLTEEREKIRKAAENQANLKVSEQEQLIGQLKSQLADAQRRMEQGSMQRQGEAQELIIEEWLREQFPLDTIDEIKKGERGADCLQTVNTRAHTNCGTIYYESKRTKHFQATWIEKFKMDMREKNASIGVLVTEAMPADMERMGQVDGVWVCSYEEFKSLCHVLRESLVQLSVAIVAQENKGDKMGMLYDFLTGNEFRMQVEAIVEGFTQMKTDLDKEKRLLHKQWKLREKQIDKVVLNTVHMYGSIRGIAGTAVQPVALLELPDDDDEDEERLLEDE